MYKGIIIYLSIILGVALLVGGSLLTIDNIIEPKGWLFEGIAGISLGIILLMIIVVANSVGKAFIIFGEILEQTVELNKQIANANKPSKGLFSGLMRPGSSIQVTNLDTGETASSDFKPGDTSDVVKLMNDMIMKAMGGNIHHGKSDNKELKELSNVQLEEKLAEAIKNEDFETASKINAILKVRKGSDEDNKKDSENKSE